MSDLAIEVRGLRKSYGDFEAVRGIDFAVRRGEIFGLLGPNGAGKTTTVEILEGYRPRTRGQVAVLGYDPGERPRALRERIGIVLQSTGLYRHIRVREALVHFAAMYPHPRDVDEVIALTGLEGKEDAMARTLSGGQLRRLDLALALVGDPELIFLDEPTTGFDPAARRNAWETISSLKDLGKTVLLTTHYLEEAQRWPIGWRSSRTGGSSSRARPATSARCDGAARYRVAYHDGGGELVEHETDDPTSAAARADERGAGSRRAPRGPDRDAPNARGRLPRADRRRTEPQEVAGWLSSPSWPGASTASSAACSGATRARRSSTSCCRCCSWPCSERSSMATSTTST